MDLLDKSFPEGCLEVATGRNVRYRSWLFFRSDQEGDLDLVVENVRGFAKRIKDIKNYVFQIRKKGNNIVTYVVMNLYVRRNPQNRIGKLFSGCEFFIVHKLDVARRFCCSKHNRLIGPVFCGFTKKEKDLYTNKYSLLTKSYLKEDEFLSLEVYDDEILFDEADTKRVMTYLGNLEKSEKARREAARCILSGRENRKLLATHHRILDETQERIKEYQPIIDSLDTVLSSEPEIEETANDPFEEMYVTIFTGKRLENRGREDFFLEEDEEDRREDLTEQRDVCN